MLCICAPSWSLAFQPHSCSLYNSREHAAAAVDPLPAVVAPAAQGVQLPGWVLLPAAAHKPRGQRAQSGPPRPAAQMLTARDGRGWVFPALDQSGSNHKGQIVRQCLTRHVHNGPPVQLAAAVALVPLVVRPIGQGLHSAFWAAAVPPAE